MKTLLRLFSENEGLMSYEPTDDLIRLVFAILGNTDAMKEAIANPQKAQRYFWDWLEDSGADVDLYDITSEKMRICIGIESDDGDDGDDGSSTQDEND